MSESQEHRTDPGKPRRSYRKPTIVQVELRAEEAVLSACKSGTVNGPTPIYNLCYLNGGNCLQTPS